MLKSLLLSSAIFISQSPQPDNQFLQLKTQLESYGFKVNLAIPPNFNPPQQKQSFLRRRLRKPFGLLNSKSKSIWINPVVFELGISNPVLIHEAAHAAQYCFGKGKVQPIELDIEPIQQAQPFFNRYANVHSRNVEKEAYAVQTQANSFELATSLLDQHCQ